MAIKYIIDVEHQVIFSYVSGTVAYQELIAYHAKLKREVCFNPSFKVIMDFRDAIVQLSSDEIKTLASNSIYSPAAYRALVATADYAFGQSRMFSTYIDFSQQAGQINESHVIVFRDMDKAIGWLGVPLKLAYSSFATLRAQDNQE